jgi:hypothetical protein
MTKPRVMYILYHYPQISETYIKSEIEAVQDECDIRVVSLNRADVTYRNHLPFLHTDDPVRVREAIAEFRPHVLHTHWLNLVQTLGYFGGYFGDGGATGLIRLRVRANSFEVLGSGGEHVRRARPMLNSELCLGVLTFPFTRGRSPRPACEGQGPRLLPVVNFRRFHDRSPNGRAVMMSVPASRRNR